MEALSPRPRFALTRHLLALALTFGILPYAYGRWLVDFMQGIRRPHLAYAVAAALVILIPLTWGLRPRLRGLGTLLGWFVAVTGLLVWVAAPRMPLWQLLAVFVPSTVWVVWLAWLGVWPLRRPARLGLLAVWLALGGLAPALLHVEGYTGDTTGRAPTLVIGWRQFTRPQFVAAAGKAALVPTSHDFPRFLGPDGTGVLPGATIAGDWTAAPPRELWRRPVGAGWGGFAVVGDYAFTQEQRDGQECVTCYRVRDGEPVWVHADARVRLAPIHPPAVRGRRRPGRTRADAARLPALPRPGRHRRVAERDDCRRLDRHAAA